VASVKGVFDKTVCKGNLLGVLKEIEGDEKLREALEDAVRRSGCSGKVKLEISATEPKGLAERLVYDLLRLTASQLHWTIGTAIAGLGFANGIVDRMVPNGAAERVSSAISNITGKPRTVVVEVDAEDGADVH
jgi:hypothetical protein